MKKLLFAALIVLLLSYQRPSVCITSYVADLHKSEIALFWKNENGSRFGSLANLKKHLESHGKRVRCLMNAGMFKNDFSPQGLFVQNKKTQVELDNSDASGNFYLKPNGVFFITSKGKAQIVETGALRNGEIEFATQSGPMLLIDGKMHSAFKQGSANVNIRNGVGILANGNVLFAISDEPVNFYDFAMFFQNAGCRNALYLDGFVSRAYIPGTGKLDMDGNFGPMIAVFSKD